MTLLEVKPYTKNLRLLIVEDDEQIRASTVAVFKRLFSVVDEATDGAEGLMIFQSHPQEYDLILTDINMPNMDGIQMIEEIRKVDALIPIVVLSAHTEFDRLIKVINAGADSFLPKPLNTRTTVDSFYRLSVRISDAKMMHEHISILEEENDLLLKELKTLRPKETSLVTPVTPEIFTIEVPQQEKIIVDNSAYYNDLSAEDIHELADLVSEIEDYIILTSKKTVLNESYINNLSTSFQKFGSIQYRYPIFWPLALSLFGLASGIVDRRDALNTKQEFVIPFLQNLIFVLQKYVEDVWKRPATNPNFYDASLINDIEMFLAILGGEEQQEVNNADDLLEFF